MPTEASTLYKGMSTLILQINRMTLQDGNTSDDNQVVTSFENEEWPILNNFNNEIDNARGRPLQQSRSNHGYMAAIQMKDIDNSTTTRMIDITTTKQNKQDKPLIDMVKSLKDMEVEADLVLKVRIELVT